MTVIIGIDCATDPRKTGLAFGVFHGGLAVIERTALGSSLRPVAATVAEWLQGVDRAVIALDPPLGWPLALGDELVRHRAGGAIGATATAMFSRATDEAIRTRFKKRPLEVGANLIARTAHAGLCLLDDVRRATGLAIPLAWHAGDPSGVVAIEVYPAATCIAHQIADRSDLTRYCAATGAADTRQSALSEHERDAVWCAVAAGDFCRGDVAGPSDLVRAQREGWIWAYQKPAVVGTELRVAGEHSTD